MTPVTGEASWWGDQNAVEMRLFDLDRLLHGTSLARGIGLATDAGRTGSTVARGDQDQLHCKNPSLDPSGVSAKFDLTGNSCAHGAGRTARDLRNRNERARSAGRAGKNLSSCPGKAVEHKIPNEFSGGQGKIRVGQGLSDRKSVRRMVLRDLHQIWLTSETILSGAT